MKKNIIVSSKSWHKKLVKNLNNREGEKWLLINSKNEFNFEFLSKHKPNYIFIPHWSHIIPSEIYMHFNCILFHMTDLPYGRGGSPLQNLILKGHKETKISAIKVSKGIDSGPIYLKKNLDLYGSAKNIFLKSTDIIYEMIVEILDKNPIPVAQKGEIINFKRRNATESCINDLTKLEKIYDYIRMLDAEDYPPAFLETSKFIYKFNNAELINDEIIANVRIIKK